MKICLPGIFLFFSFPVLSANLSGVVKDDKGNILPFASIFIKGSGKGTTANSEGKYLIQLEKGEYVIVCQYVGFEKKEVRIAMGDNDQVLDFTLALQKTTMKEFVVKAGAEDPAYAIIRQAIKKRKVYQNQYDRFQCEVYTKGILQLRDYPTKFMGRDVDLEDGDTSKRKILYLTESIATYSFEKPDKSKVEILSTRVSGQRDGFGLSQPQIISFYDNNIQVGRNLNARGFVSPVADGALSLYRYKLEGVFFEDGKEINRIRVIPKRKYEPVFSGYINIIEDDWRIHSLQLQLTKESQMDLLDTLRIDQLYIPLEGGSWVIKNQVIYPAVKMFGFSAYGSFVNVYSKFDLAPAFRKDFFGNTLLKFLDSSNKRPESYWDSTRPLPLQQEEITDYKRKDSLEQLRSQPHYLDSIDRKRNRFNFVELLGTGQTFSRRSRRETYSVGPLVDAVNFNTAEGLVLNFRGTYSKHSDSNSNYRRRISLTPTIRYGFSNHHLNGSLSTMYTYGKGYAKSIVLEGGKNVFQFNNESPVRERDNTLATLLLEKNLIKTYEAWYGRIQFARGLGEGLVISGMLEYQDRMPLENTTDFKIRDVDYREYTPNYPVQLLTENIHRHQATLAGISLNWQPGAKYIEFPERKIRIGSRYPNFMLGYTKGLKGLFGSDVDYDKWRFMIFDEIQMKLAGNLNYRFSMGGFINSKYAAVPDYQHFNGNQVIFASPYLNSFQLADYYRNSTTENWFSTIHAEYHLNGLLTNKIPLIKKLNWHLVTGSNAFYVNKANNYVEVFAGLENIFRVLRIDFVQSFSSSRKPHSGIVIGVNRDIIGN